MSLLDSLKSILGGKKDAGTASSATIPGLPEDMNTVDEIKDKVQETITDNTVDKITDAIPGEMDDMLADQILGNDKK